MFETKLSAIVGLETMRVRVVCGMSLTTMMTVMIHASCVGAEEGQRPEPRAARSVHLGYMAPEAAVFHVEMTVLQSTPGSFFMAAGWNAGYFGLQELGDGRKVVIFSVWDPTPGDDPNAVADGERVECLHHADGVRVKRFGGEGTGGQCMGDFDWKIGDRHRFAVAAKPDGDKTAYAGFLWRAITNDWLHLVTFRTRLSGRGLSGRGLGGLYSFLEDFRRDGRSVREMRRARFGDAWAQTSDGAWQPLRAARFTASKSEWEAKETIDARIVDGDFMLATGGATRPSRPPGSMLEVPAAAARPPDLPFALGRRE